MKWQSPPNKNTVISTNGRRRSKLTLDLQNVLFPPSKGAALLFIRHTTNKANPQKNNIEIIAWSYKQEKETWTQGGEEMGTGWVKKELYLAAHSHKVKKKS